MLKKFYYACSFKCAFSALKDSDSALTTETWRYGKSLGTVHSWQTCEKDLSRYPKHLGFYMTAAIFNSNIK